MTALPAALLARLIRPFRPLPAPVHIQVFATLVNNMGGIAKLFLPLFFLEHFQLGYGRIGLLMGLYGAGCVAGAYLGGQLSDRFDARRLCALLLAGSGLSTFMLALPWQAGAYAPLLLVAGLCDGGFRPGNMRLVLEPCPPALRLTAQGYYRVAFNLGVSLAGLTGGLLASLGYHWVFVAQGSANLLACVWLVWAYRRWPATAGARAGAPSASPALATTSPWRDGPFLVFILGQLIIMAAFDQIYGTFSLFLREHYHASPSLVGMLFTLNGLMVVGLQVAIAHRVGRWGLIRSAQLGVLLTGGAYAFLNLGHGAFFAVITMVVLTVGELLLSPTWSALVMQHSEGRRRGSYLGLFNAAWSGRTLYAPALGTWVYGALGPALLWWSCVLLALLTMALHAYALPRMRSAAAPQQ